MDPARMGASLIFPQQTSRLVWGSFRSDENELDLKGVAFFLVHLPLGAKHYADKFLHIFYFCATEFGGIAFFLAMH